MCVYHLWFKMQHLNVSSVWEYLVYERTGGSWPIMAVRRKSLLWDLQTPRFSCKIVQNWLSMLFICSLLPKNMCRWKLVAFTDCSPRNHVALKVLLLSIVCFATACTMEEWLHISNSYSIVGMIDITNNMDRQRE